MRTRFYRLPNLKNDSEYNRLFKVFHTIPSTKKKFITYMANKLQEKVRTPKLKQVPLNDDLYALQFKKSKDNLSTSSPS
jgi:hypothetical protein